VSDDRPTTPPPPGAGGGKPLLRRTISSAAVIETRRSVIERLRRDHHRAVDAGVDAAETAVDQDLLRFGMRRYNEGIQVGREALGVLCPAYLAIFQRNFEAAAAAPLHATLAGPPWVTARELVAELRARGYQTTEDDVAETCRIAHLPLRETDALDDGA
jgi:hypothetical protein